MSKKRKPTRRDLLIVIGRLQTLSGRLVSSANNDRHPNRAAQIQGIGQEIQDLCISARGQDDPIYKNLGPWGESGPEKDYI